jgi:aminoglycoside N3'-acetyltransferase
LFCFDAENWWYMKKHSKFEIISHLRAMGIKNGDTVLVRASLNKIGRVESPSKKVIMDSLLEAVGSDGTIVSLGFTKSYFLGIGAKAPSKHFTVDSKPNIGALANLFLQHPSSVRSTHPTNSYIAIGKHANDIIEGHDESSLSYSPISKLISLNGKMILIGCIKDSPGFTTVHYAQEKLGLTKKNIICRLQRVYYWKIDKIALFTRKDAGGCSAGFRTFYSDYLEENKLTIGHVGDAPSMLINAKDSFEIEYKRISENNKYFMCDNPLCLSCRASWLFNLGSIPKFLINKTLNLIQTRGK